MLMTNDINFDTGEPVIHGSVQTHQKRPLTFAGIPFPPDHTRIREPVEPTNPTSDSHPSRPTTESNPIHDSANLPLCSETIRERPEPTEPIRDSVSVKNEWIRPLTPIQSESATNQRINCLSFRFSGRD
jgi:hypothetical protein